MDTLRNTATRLGLRVSENHTEFWAPATRLGQQPERRPVAGARVTIQEGASRVTATRAIAIGLFALAAKKGSVFLVFEGPDWQWTHTISRRQADLARKFADEFNTAAGTAGLRT